MAALFFFGAAKHSSFNLAANARYPLQATLSTTIG